MTRRRLFSDAGDPFLIPLIGIAVVLLAALIIGIWTRGSRQDVRVRTTPATQSFVRSTYPATTPAP